MAKPLTPLAIEKAKSGASRREIPDGGCKGLYLVIQPSGAKSWAFRYRLLGQPKKLTLGPVYSRARKHGASHLGEEGDEPEHAVINQANTLAGARELAAAAARQVAKGLDPARKKERDKAEARQTAENALALDRDTVEAVARLFIEKHARANTKDRSWLEAARIIGLRPDPADDTKLIRTETGGEVLSRWGSRNIHDIGRRDVHDLLDAIKDRGAPVVANRTLSHIRKMFNWAVQRDILAVSPCAGVSKPSVETSRDRVLGDDELRLVWLAAERIGWPFGPVVQMLILTLQRRVEVAGMHRKELHERSWVIAKERSKNGQAHEVPLSAAALDLLASMPTIGKAGIVFTVTGDAVIRGFSRAKERLDAEILKLRGEPLRPWTFHDLRRTGASGMARLGVRLEVIEKVLNHTGGSFRGVAGVYQRHSYADEKRAALELWARHVLSIVEGMDNFNVISLNKR
jgi:integrase